MPLWYLRVYLVRAFTVIEEKLFINSIFKFRIKITLIKKIILTALLYALIRA